MTQKNQSKTLKVLKRILELLWLFLAIMALAIAVKETISVGFAKSWFYYAFSAIAIFFFITRRKQRLNEN